MIPFIVGAIVGCAVMIPLAYLYSKRAVRRAKRMEARLRSSERLAYVGSLAGGLAHEIKNPLSTLNLNLQLIKEDWQNASSPKEVRLCRKLEVLQREARRLEEILNDFLRFARGQELDLKEHDLNVIVDDVVTFITPEAEANHVTIHKMYDHTLPKIKVDGDLIKQALLNVVINAQQAMPDGGELIIRTSRQDDEVRVEITDTGVGMTEETMSRIFNVYFSTKKGGTGLGLPTTRRIIQEHGGDITVQSEPSKGSCFTITLPVSPPDLKAGTEA